jgi:hypothetical protein
MSDGVVQEIAGERDDVLDVQRLIEAVRGSRAARVLYELRAWLPRSSQEREDGTASESAFPPNPRFTSGEAP